MPTVRIDDDVFKGLQALAEPFTDTPNSVIRRLLEQAGALPRPHAMEPRAPHAQAPASPGETVTPQPLYETFLLHVLACDFKGRGQKHEITKAVIELMTRRGFLTAADHKTVSTGETRAENTIAWGRNALKARGLISKNSPRGTWELTDQGLREGSKTRLPSGPQV